MTPLRIATYNVEWFNGLFDDAGGLLADDQPSARYHVTRAGQIGALGTVFTALDADAVLVVEAPDTNARRSTVTALESFARQFGLRARKAVMGFASDTEQEIALLYDPDRLSARHDPKGGTGSPAPRFDGSFHHHLDGNSGPEVIRFDKPPLEILLTPVEGRPIRLIGVHVKSKAPHGAQDAADVTRLSIQNRRKQLAQCLWIRQRVEGHLTAGDDVIVLGDFNDGPGLDEYEKLFGQSGVEVVLGTAPDPGLRLYDPHAAMALQSRVALAPTTARFYLAPQSRFFEALLDFIMVSRGLAARQPAWRIWHPFNDPAILADPGLSGALLRASDHFPVTLDLPIVN